MLTAGKVSDLVNLRLSTEVIREELAQLTSDVLELHLISWFVDSIRETVIDGVVTSPEPVMDCSGTGGSGLPHFNTSTTVAFILAAGKVRTAKFGNRATGSMSGSFDFLEALGIPAHMPPEHANEILDEVGLVFLFAPQYYPGLGRLAAIRRSLPGPTIFNSIGPLLHPLKPAFRLMGTSDQRVQALIADFLRADNQTARAAVVRSECGLDEIDPAYDSQVMEIDSGELHESLIEGKSVAPPPELSKVDFTPSRNFETFCRIIDGTAHPYFTALVCANAGVAFKVRGTSNTFAEGEQLALELLRSGTVKEKFEQCRRAYAGFVS